MEKPFYNYLVEHLEENGWEWFQDSPDGGKWFKFDDGGNPIGKENDEEFSLLVSKFEKSYKTGYEEAKLTSKQKTLIVLSAVGAMRKTLQENLGLSESQIILLDDRLSASLNVGIRNYLEEIF